MNMSTEQEIAHWERAFGPLTDEERKLLLLPKSLRGNLDGQRAFVLRTYMVPMECPACQTGVPPRQALGRPINHSQAEDTFHCPHCHRGLQLCVALIGPDWWRLRTPLEPLETEQTCPGGC